MYNIISNYKRHALFGVILRAKQKAFRQISLKNLKEQNTSVFGHSTHR